MADGLPTERAFPAYAPRVASEFRASVLQVPLFGDEQLVVAAVNLHTTITASLITQGRLWSDAEKAVRYFEDELTLAPGQTRVETTILERGSILTLRHACNTVGIGMGDLWVSNALVKGATGSTMGTATLLQGYVGLFNNLAWPGSPVQDLHSGRGRIRTFAWTIAGGIAANAFVPTGRRWRVICGAVNVTTSAVVGNRSVQCLVTNGGAIVFWAESTPVQAAGGNLNYTLGPGLNSSGVAGVQAQIIPFLGDLELRAGDQLNVAINASLAGDAMTGLGLVVREWFDP